MQGYSPQIFGGVGNTVDLEKSGLRLTPDPDSDPETGPTADASPIQKQPAGNHFKLVLLAISTACVIAFFAWFARKVA